jgi:hypothetical protein
MQRNIHAALLILLTAAPLWAQGRTSSGLFGSRTVGGSFGGGNRSALGSGGSFGGAGGGMNQLSNAGQITGSERFLRDNRTAGQFVGSDNTDSSFVGALSTGGSGFSSGARMGAGGGLGGGLGGALGRTGSLGLGGGSLGLGGARGTMGGAFGMGGQRGNQRMGQNGRMMNNMGMNANSNRRINARTTLEVGFRYRALPATTVHSKLVERLNDNRVARLGPLEVELNDRVATLRGRVATQDDRDLARRLAKMEPGVETVVDELTVDPSASAEGSPSDQP